MGILFRWFKDYKIEQQKFGCYIDSQINYIGGGATTHSAHYVIQINRLFQKYTGIEFPTIDERFIDPDNPTVELITPNSMAAMCQKILQTDECSKSEVQERIEWFLKLSNDGYYIAYESAG